MADPRIGLTGLPARAAYPEGSAPVDCGRSFDEALLSGYLDRALVQADEQRVRLHLEDCGHCRQLLAELEELQLAARSTRFRLPTDDQWSELPRGGLSRWLRRAGWVAFVAAGLALAVRLLWELAAAARGSVIVLLAGGLLAGLALLFVSVLIDRLRAAPGDRYREVQK